MGRNKSKSKKGSTSAAVTVAAVVPPTYTIPELLLQAAQHISSCEYDLARGLCETAVRGAQARIGTEQGEKDLTESYEMLGTAELELGFLDLAREHFLSSVFHASHAPDPSPAPHLYPSPAPHLYLAQLSTPIESLTHFSNALTILQAKLAVIERSKLGGDGSAGGVVELEEEGELRRSASRALVGMTELYLTDLCFEEEAEAKCELNLAMAAVVDPSDPEVYHTLASVRLSQERPEDAEEAALKGWFLWRKLEPDSPSYPPYHTRLALARLFLELSLHSNALEILQRLENEDDEDGEIWYLSGWAWWLLGEEREENESTPEEESRGECWSEAKLCLENYLKLDDRDPEVSDPEQLVHVNEIMEKLNEAGVIASVGHEEGDEEGDWDEEEEEEDGDVMMQ